jgi:hypothetical protein
MKRRERTPDADRLKMLPRPESSGKERHLRVGAESVGANATGTMAIGSAVIGALAIGALAIGALAIGRLVIGRARIRRLEIDELVVRRIRITEAVQVPDRIEAQKSASAQEADSAPRHDRSGPGMFSQESNENE